MEGLEPYLLNLAVGFLAAVSQRLIQLLSYYVRERKAKAITAERAAGITAEDHDDELSR